MYICETVEAKTEHYRLNYILNSISITQQLCECVNVCPSPVVSEGDQRRPSLPGEPADDQPKHRLEPRVQA